MMQVLSIEKLLHIETQLIDAGYVIVPNLIGPELCQSLVNHAQSLFDSHILKQAQIGQKDSKTLNTHIRGDATHWLEADTDIACEQAYLHVIRQLQSHFNQTLFMGLQDFECHYARYPVGARYQKHLDQFKGDDLRQVTCILYLNENWEIEQGGALRLYLNADENEFLDVLPQAGTMVIFLSERFYHEVLPATRERISLTGWLRKRALTLL